MKKHNDKKIDEVLKEMVESYRLKTNLNETTIQKAWPRLMGGSISRYTRQISLRKRKLYLTIDSASLRQELSYSKEKIKNMLNKELGEEYIEQVILR